MPGPASVRLPADYWLLLRPLLPKPKVATYGLQASVNE